MIAEQAAELIAPFIEGIYPQDEKRIFSILRLGINRAWKEGKWHGMTAEMFVPVQTDKNGTKFCISPFNYSNMLAVNVDCKPRTFRDHHFMFHKNGAGDVMQQSGSCDWNQDVYDEGVKPCLFDFKQEFPNGAHIAVRSLSEAGENDKMWIQGSSKDEASVISFENRKNKVFSGCNCVEVSEKDMVRSVFGLEFNLNRNFQYINNIIFTDIASIKKTVTAGVVEVIAFDSESGKGKRINLLYPWERESGIKRYRLPKTSGTTVHGLFKIDEQPIIVDGSQPIIIKDDEAIISLAIGVHLVYHKLDIQKGTVYIKQGINALEKEKREKESPDVFPLQVIGMTADDTPDILKY